jgi:hypothetical protein
MPPYPIHKPDHKKHPSNDWHRHVNVDIHTVYRISLVVKWGSSPHILARRQQRKRPYGQDDCNRLATLTIPSPLRGRAAGGGPRFLRTWPFIALTWRERMAIEPALAQRQTPVGDMSDWAMQAFHRIIYVIQHWMGSQRISTDSLGEESQP